MPSLSRCLLSRHLAPLALCLLVLGACGPVEESSLSLEPEATGEAGQSIIGATDVDMVEYILPSCGDKTKAWNLGYEQFRTVPAGSNRFVIMKHSSKPDDFEEWYVDHDYLRIRIDRTWAYCVTATQDYCPAGTPEAEQKWCDTQCGLANNRANCRQRHAGQTPVTSWAQTLYYEPVSTEPSNRNIPAKWIKRKLPLARGGSYRFSVPLAIQGQNRDGVCSMCGTNFDSTGTTRTVLAVRHDAWNGYRDVVELRVEGGPGAGESYFYGRGLGWLGFGGRVTSGWSEPASTNPATTCASYPIQDICQSLNAPGATGAAKWCDLYTETGFNLCGRFKEFWSQNGGLGVYGFPISAHGPHPGEGGKLFNSQWFERMQLELHPEDTAFNQDVKLARLGVQAFQRKNGVDWSTQARETARTGCRFYSATGFNVCNTYPATGTQTVGFLNFFAARGLDLGDTGTTDRESVALFGLPISGLRYESHGGVMRYVQYFERARLEWHPNNTDPYRVQMGLLGRELKP